MSTEPMSAELMSTEPMSTEPMSAERVPVVTWHGYKETTGEYAKEGFPVVSHWIWHTCPSYNQLNFEKFRSIKDHVYGGFSHDHCIFSKVGTNIYSGLVSTEQPQASYHRAKHCVTDHQYYRSHWKLTLMPLFQKTLKKLTMDAVAVSKYLDPLHHKVLSISQKWIEQSYRGFCSLSILTMANNKVQGFGSSLHKDVQDCCDKKTLENGLDRLNDMPNATTPAINERVEYAKRMVGEVNLGVLTICGYQICISEQSDLTEEDVYAFFYMGALNAAVRIRSNYFHYFHAYAFHHQTAVSVVRKDGKVYYNHPDVDILGWGLGKSKRRRSRRIRGLPPPYPPPAAAPPIAAALPIPAAAPPAESQIQEQQNVARLPSVQTRKGSPPSPVMWRRRIPFPRCANCQGSDIEWYIDHLDSSECGTMCTDCGTTDLRNGIYLKLL